LILRKSFQFWESWKKRSIYWKYNVKNLYENIKYKREQHAGVIIKEGPNKGDWVSSWAELDITYKNGKTVVSLKPATFSKTNSFTTQNVISTPTVLLSDEQFESIKKYLEKKLYLQIRSAAFEMAKMVVDKYYQDKTEAEYIAALEEYVDYFSKLMIVGDEQNENTSEGSEEKN
jgi:hypothetical protein